MQKLLAFTALLTLISSFNANAALATHRSLANFLAAVDSDYYFEDFDARPRAFIEAPVDFGPVNGFSYTAMATEGIALFSFEDNDIFLSTLHDTDTLTLTFTGRDVTAIGGEFFPSGRNGQELEGAMELTFSDGSELAFRSMRDPRSNALGFRGFVSDVPITSIEINATSGLCLAPNRDQCWASVENLYIGSALSSTVPLPAAGILLGLGCVGLGLQQRQGRRGRAR